MSMCTLVQFHQKTKETKINLFFAFITRVRKQNRQMMLKTNV